MNEAKQTDLWNELDKPREGGNFFSPKEDVPYKITIKSAEMVYMIFDGGKLKEVPTAEVDKLKEEGKNPKLKVKAHLATIDGKPVEQVWTSGSFVIMREINKYRKQNVLPQIQFLLKKKGDANKVTYVFEALNAPAEGGNSPSPDGVESYL